MVSEGEQSEATASTTEVTKQDPVGEIQPKIESANSNPVPTSDPPPPPSKKSLKRAAKAIKWEQTKKLKRMAEKQKMKRKRLERPEGAPKPISRNALKKHGIPIDWDSNVAPRVVIDLSFDHLMTYSEKSKTAKQLLRCYTLNRRAPKQVRLYFAGMKPNSESFEIFQRNSGYEYWDVKMPPESYQELFPNKSEIVYLTSDSETVLEQLNNDDVYVIGGLVDHNRYKGFCFETAGRLGIRTARLPIKENVVLKSRTVLTIEQVFNILSQVYNGSDWKSTIMDVVPLRKGAKALPTSDSEDVKVKIEGIKQEIVTDDEMEGDPENPSTSTMTIKSEPADDSDADMESELTMLETLIKKEEKSIKEESDYEMFIKKKEPVEENFYDDVDC